MGEGSQIPNVALRTKIEMRTVAVLHIFYLLDICVCLFVHDNHYLFPPSSHYFTHTLLEVNSVIESSGNRIFVGTAIETEKLFV